MKSAFIIAIVAVAMIGVMVPSVFAETIYPTNTHRVDAPPSYCAVTPSDTSYLPRLSIFSWEAEVEEAIDDWRTKLQNGVASEFKYLWNLSYLGSDTEPLPNCDYPIYLKPYSDDSEEWFESLGIFTWSSLHHHVEIYFLQILHELVGEDAFYDYYDFDSLRTDSQIGGTVRHEIGHSLGLGHYSTDDYDVKIKWSKLTVLPSIMLTGYGTDKDFRPITALDISKVRAIYGGAGFYAFSTVPIPQPTVPTPQPTVPTPPPILPIIPIFPIESMGVDSNEIIVDRHSTQYLKIFGDISDNEFMKGHPVFLQIKYPDLTEELLRITPTSNGHFETTLSFDHKDLLGSYTISATYLFHTDNSKDVKFKIISKEESTQSKSQITNQQSSSLTNDDYDGDGITDNNDTCPYDAETFNGYQDTDGCPDKLPNQVPSIPSLTVEADKSVYGHDDTITVTGQVSNVISGNEPISILVYDPSGNLAYIDLINLANDGSYATTIDTWGNLMKYDGTYTIEANYGDLDIHYDIELVDNPPIITCGSSQVLIHDTCMPYDITSGDVISATINNDDNSIILNIDADDDGVLVISPSTSIQKGIFMVLIDGEQVMDDGGFYSATISGNTVIVGFPGGTEQIEIVGTYVIPEFGTLAAMILAVAIISIVAISAKSRLSIVPRY